MKLYIAGQMAGIEELNHPAFFKAEHRLRNLGHDVINPARLDAELLPEGLSEGWLDGLEVDNADRAKFLHRDFIELLTCDGIFLLRNWSFSTGANCELMLMRMAGKPAYMEMRTPKGDELVEVRYLPEERVIRQYIWDLTMNTNAGGLYSVEGY